MKKTKVKILGASLAVALFSVNMAGCTASKQASVKTAETYSRTEIITSAKDAKQLLEDGNKRFVSGNVLNKNISDTRRKDLSANGQHPFAVVVGCSDSRVAAEEIFDQGLGDIFVVRDAGNVIDPIVLGSIEYGAEHLGSPLIVVLGHEKCGAVKATVDGGEAAGSIDSIVEKIKPSLEKVKAAGTASADLAEKTTDENIKNSIVDIEKSPVIKHLVESGKVTVVGAKYHIETGEVTFIE
ncbi:MAG: carbonic anhydrase [Clostridiaceae bacterium]